MIKKKDKLPAKLDISDVLSETHMRKVEKAEYILSYTFNNKALLAAALTHPSASEGNALNYSYERLEFLGDSILGSIVAYAAYTTYPQLDEGGLTSIKVALVSGGNLSSLAEKLGLQNVIIFGSSETGTGIRGLHSALENVYEALVAALYIDGGYAVAEKFVRRTLLTEMDISLAKVTVNPKNELQELLQKDGITPYYSLIKTEGPPHDRIFTTEVYAGDTFLARASGRSKKESETRAAHNALKEYRG